jgi:hypothetical protein
MAASICFPASVIGNLLLLYSTDPWPFGHAGYKSWITVPFGTAFAIVQKTPNGAYRPDTLFASEAMDKRCLNLAVN